MAGAAGLRVPAARRPGRRKRCGCPDHV